MYKGTKAHRSSTWSATAFLYCTITKATRSSLIGKCDGVIALGGSMLILSQPRTLQLAARCIRSPRAPAST